MNFSKPAYYLASLFCLFALAMSLGLASPVHATAGIVTRNDIVAKAREYGNAPNQYQSGAEGQLTFCGAVGRDVPAFDCSGFVYTVFNDLGAADLIGGSRKSSAEYYAWFKSKGLVFSDPSLLRPGDLVYYCSDTPTNCGTPASTLDHIAIYVGNQGVIHTRKNNGLCQDIQETGMSPTLFGVYELKYTREPFAYLRVPYQGTNLTLASIAAQDGWVLESGENTDMGGTKNSTLTTLFAGDDAANRQYISVLSFNSALPVNAVITSVTLKFKYAGFSGTIPFLTHSQLLVDVNREGFANNLVLQLEDLKAPANFDTLFALSDSRLNGWYVVNFAPSEFQSINPTGSTQFRLRFALDDNNDSGADLLKIYSGNALVSMRPQLSIEYYLP